MAKISIINGEFAEVKKEMASSREIEPAKEVVPSLIL